MGTDKALLPLRPGDPPLALTVIHEVSKVAGEVIVVASDRPAYAAFGVPVIPDLETSAAAGTLGGILSALMAVQAEHCLIVACDLPFLNFALLHWMSEQPRDYDVLVPRLPGESRQRDSAGLVYQTLHAIYSKACIEPIQRQLENGQRQVIGFFDDVRVREIDAATIARYDPYGRSFFNANTPQALQEARHMMSAGADRTKESES